MKSRAIFEAWSIFLVLFVLAGGAVFLAQRWSLCWIIVGVLGVFVIFTIYFFRDPERVAPSDAELAIAPADGVVVEVSDCETADGSPVRRVGIFLSVFDVHVNRSPIAGVVESSVERTGKFLDARNPQCSVLNARREWVIRGERVTVRVRQITGAIARRIVAWSKPGDSLDRGERFGMIRFGSRTEADFPPGTEILVKPGERVRCGETPIARIPL